MLNELLTGKASLEQKPEPIAPYRELAVLPPLHHACVTCNQRYEAPAGSTANLCAKCQLEIVEANARNDRLAYHASVEQVRRAENSHRVIAVLGGIVVIAGLAFFRYGMRKQQREDAAVAAGYSSYSEYETKRDAVYPTDAYSYEVKTMADEMCRCRDLACARDLHARFRNFLRFNSPTDDKAEESARQDSIRLEECKARLE